MVNYYLTREPKIINREKTVSLISGTGKTVYHMHKNEIGSLSYTTHKINFKQIKYLNVRPKTLKLLDDNMGKSFTTLDLTMISWL